MGLLCEILFIVILDMPVIHYVTKNYSPLSDIMTSSGPPKTTMYVGTKTVGTETLAGKMSNGIFFYVYNGKSMRTTDNFKLLKKPTGNQHFEWQQGQQPFNLNVPPNAISVGVNNAGKKMYIIKVVIDANEDPVSYYVEGDNYASYAFYGVKKTANFYWCIVVYDRYP